MHGQVPKTRDIVLVGGGHTHALVLRMWGMRGLPGARLTLIDPGPTTSYSGMLPGYIAGHYRREELEIDLVRLARFADARLIMSPATGINLEVGTVEVAGRSPVAFDLLSLDIGIHGAMDELPGFSDYATAAKPLDRFATKWAAFLDSARSGSCLSAVVIGAGIAGIELALAMRHGAAMRALGLDVTVLDRSAALHRVQSATARKLRRAMKAADLTLLENVHVKSVTSNAVMLLDGRQLSSDFTVAAGGPRPYAWLNETGLALEKGYVSVGPKLQSPTDPRVFAAGDCAHLSHAPRPKAGVFAVRAAPVLYANLNAALGAGAWRQYRPQADFLKLISAGSRTAIADRGISLQGRWLWWAKDRIDRRFMKKLSDLKPMSPPRIPARAAPGVADKLLGPGLCGGCGAKLGRSTLGPALTILNRGRPDVELGPGDDAAVIRIGADKMVITTDHLRAFTEDPYVVSRVAAIHALGDVFAMGAAPQVVLPSLTLPPLSENLQARTLDEIMLAASDVFSAAGAEIVGGHSSMGAELSVGFTVTGILERRPITLDGARQGDVLILTKPIGVGVILAAEMALAAHGRDVAAALDSMQLGIGPAAEILRDAHAMTDVTGFGLAGHLLGMLDASGVAAVLALDALPVLNGAEDLVKAGYKSSIFAENSAFARPRTHGPDDPRLDLLFDPQTAGGLLAAVAPELANSTKDALCAAGYCAAIIGSIVPGMAHITIEAEIEAIRSFATPERGVA